MNCMTALTIGNAETACGAFETEERQRSKPPLRCQERPSTKKRSARG